MMELFLTITGTNPIILHNERLANPFDPLKREMAAITSKRKKTDDDIMKICRIEFEGGLYLNSQGPFLPAWNIKKALIEGGRINKLGKHVERAFTPTTAEVPLIYDGPRDVQGLWDQGFSDTRSVRVGQSKVIRCRPKFEQWSLQVPCALDTSILNIEEFAQVAKRTGEMVGLGTFRQRFGRFEVAIK